MLQRVLIAIAISCDPQLLVADEPTTALDVTIQAEVLELLRQLRDQRGLAVLFVSHDLAVITELCDRIAVFYSGEIVETGADREIVRRPRHPYTQALLRVASVGDFRRRELEVIAGAAAAGGHGHHRLPLRRALPGRRPSLRPAPDQPDARRRPARRPVRARPGGVMTTGAMTTGVTATPAPPLLAIENVDVTLGRGWRANQVLSGIDLGIWPGEIVGLVGETGSGKTTLARTVVGLVNPARGRIAFGGQTISALRGPARPGRTPPRPRPARLPGPAALAAPRPYRGRDRGRSAHFCRCSAPRRSAAGSSPPWARSA